jgi:hypothetical protein
MYKEIVKYKRCGTRKDTTERPKPSLKNTTVLSKRDLPDSAEPPRIII